MSEIAVFDIGGIDCAVAMCDLVSVSAYEHPVRVPGASPGVQGILPFRESAVLVINLAELFSINRTTPASRRCIAIVQPAGNGDRPCGLIVDGLRGVIDDDACSDGEVSSSVPAAYVRRNLTHHQSAIALLALDRIHERVTGAAT